MRPKSITRTTLNLRAMFFSLCVTLAIAGTDANAKTQSHVFSLYIAGFPAGTISISANKTASSYAITGGVKPTAFLRKLRDVGYSGSASGSYEGIKFRPKKYSGNTKTGSRNSTVKMRWKGSRPIVDAYNPIREKRPYDIDPAKQKGAIDLLTAAFSVFEDQINRTLCNRTVDMFDGRRRSKLALGTVKVSGDKFVCKGSYRRVAGFSMQDMAKNTTFPFTLTYKRLDDKTYRLMKFSTKTTFGSASAVRK